MVSHTKKRCPKGRKRCKRSKKGGGDPETNPGLTGPGNPGFGPSPSPPSSRSHSPSSPHSFQPPTQEERQKLKNNAIRREAARVNAIMKREPIVYNGENSNGDIGEGNATAAAAAGTSAARKAGAATGKPRKKKFHKAFRETKAKADVRLQEALLARNAGPAAAAPVVGAAGAARPPRPPMPLPPIAAAAAAGAGAGAAAAARPTFPRSSAPNTGNNNNNRILPEDIKATSWNDLISQRYNNWEGYPENKELFRYSNILPYLNNCHKFIDKKDNKVKCLNISPIFKDILKINGKNIYASECPKEIAHIPFREFLKENIETIVMVTGFEESGKKKCDDYLKKIVKSKNKIYDIDIDDKELENLERYRYKVWPDHGVPQDLDEFHQFVVAVSERHNSVPKGKGILIHCSAGVGRTGVFLVSFLLYNYLNNKEKFEGEEIKTKLENIINSIYSFESPVAGLISYLRTQRPHLVQTKAQFDFIINYFDKIVKEFKSQQAGGGSRKQRKTKKSTRKSTKKQRKHKKTTKKH